MGTLPKQQKPLNMFHPKLGNFIGTKAFFRGFHSLVWFRVYHLERIDGATHLPLVLVYHDPLLESTFWGWLLEG